MQWGQSWTRWFASPHPCGGRDLVFLVALTSIGTSIDGAGGGGFGVTRRGEAEGNLTTDIGEGRTETVLAGLEGMERDTD